MFVTKARPGVGAGRALRRLGVSDSMVLVALALLCLVALLAPLLSPESTSVPSGSAFLAPGSSGHLLGTDEVGRDVLSRILYGVRASWLSALLVIASGVVIGGTVGLVAGSVGGWVDAALMRLTDAFLALPGPLLAIAVVAALGPSLTHTLVAVMIVWWPFYARIVRGEIRALAVRPFVEAARLAGVSRSRIAFRHLLPGAAASTLVAASLDIGNLVLTLAALSFLGLGAPAPAPELGAMAARGLPNLLEHWWVPVMPGIAVLVLAVIANLAGDALRNLLADR
ncbi:MAG: ABC transporter permease [Frankiales bacterium]|nr:ABC transporter permease [Frankiales bacterium]